MNKKFLFYCAFMLLPMTVMSQNIIYDYDSNGNVIYRKFILNAALSLKSEESKTTMKFKYDPTCSKVQISIDRLSDENKKTDVAIYNGSNNLLLEMTSFIGNTGIIDLSNKQKGIYIIKAYNDEIINSTTIYKK